MSIRVLCAALAIVTLAACSGGGGGALGGLFGTARAVDPNAGTAEHDPRPLIQQITALKLERVPGGAILRATGLPPTQGYFDGALLPLNRGVPVKGVLAFQFHAAPPLEPQRSGTPQSREVIVGEFISDQTLATIRSIQVSAAANALGVRR